jgi:hypothetical protein
MPIGVYKHKTIAEGRQPGGGQKGRSGRYERTQSWRLAQSKTHKGLISAFKGKHHSDGSKEKNRLNHLGKKYPNRKRPPIFTKEHRLNISLTHKGKPSKLKGRKLSIEVRKTMSEVQKKRVLEGLHNNYKGGITPINHQIRCSLEYRLWRESVFERDNWTCVWCGERGGRLNADHIKPFAYFPELRFAIDNGRTLCESCHKKTDSYLKNLKDSAK